VGEQGPDIECVLFGWRPTASPASRVYLGVLDPMFWADTAGCAGRSLESDLMYFSCTHLPRWTIMVSYLHLPTSRLLLRLRVQERMRSLNHGDGAADNICFRMKLFRPRRARIATSHSALQGGLQGSRCMERCATLLRQP
jgi:hypothetical protein